MTLDQLEDAIALIQQGDTESARPLLIEFLKKHPQDEIAWRYLSRTILNIDERIDAMAHCLKLNPSSQWAQNELAELREQQALAAQLAPQPEGAYLAADRKDIPDGLFKAGSASPSGIQWAQQKKKTVKDLGSKKPRKRRSFLHSLQYRVAALSRGAHLAIIGVFVIVIITFAWVFGFSNIPSGASQSPQPKPTDVQTKSPTVSDADIEADAAGADMNLPSESPDPTPTATPDPVPTPNLVPIANLPSLYPGNINNIALKSQWFADEVVSLAFSPDGQLLAAASWDGTVWIWKTDTLLSEPWGRGRERYQLSHTFGVNSVAFSPDGNYLAFGMSSIEDPLQVLDVTSLYGSGPVLQDLPVRVLDGHSEGIKNVVFTPDGQFLVSASFDDTVRFWNYKTGQELTVIDGYYVEKIAITRDGRTLATAYFDAGYTTILWDLNEVLQADLAAGLEKTTVDGGPGLVFSDDGTTLITAEQRISVWDTRDFPENVNIREVLSLLGHSELVETLALSPDERLLASGSRDRKIKIWDMKTGLELVVLAGHGARIRNLVFSPDGRLLASAGDDGTIRIWGFSEGK